jgi:proline racemase
MKRIQVIDSHTGGEPTRLVLEGAPELGTGTVAERATRLRKMHDTFRSAVVCEPRGSDVLVGAVLLQPSDPACTAGVVFFNNVGYLGMCGHGLIGVLASLAHAGRLQPGAHQIETPAGKVSATLNEDFSVSFENVPAHREAAGVTVEIPGLGRIRGDVAYGGNWFYLVADHGLNLTRDNAAQLTEVAWQLRRAINDGGFPSVDHVELFGPAQSPGANSRNFVLCPGKAYDRSPCGTGTSAKLACLAAEGSLEEGGSWTQEGILGSRFIGCYRWLDRDKGTVLPTITGRAHVTAESTLLLDDRDPFCLGIC